MIKTLFLVLVVGLLVSGVYLGRDIWLPQSTTTATTTPAETVTEETPTEVPLSGRGTLSEIRSIASNLECQIWYGEPGAEATREGMVFISGVNVRGDFVSVVEGKQVVSSMIVTSDTLYTWSLIDGATYGVEKGIGATTTNQLDAREPVPLDASVRYDCTPWRPVDKSVFAPPSDVLFRDLDSLEEKGMEYGTTFESSGGAQ